MAVEVGELKPFEEAYSYFYNEQGDYTIVYKKGYEDEKLIAFCKTEEEAKYLCDMLNDYELFTN